MTKVHHIINSFLHLSVAVMIIVSLTLKTWFSYCYFDWGLAVADTDNDSLSDRVGSSPDYEDVDDELCGSFEDIIEAACDGFCGNISRFESAGTTMIVLASISTALYVIYGVVSFLNVLGKKARFYFIYYGVWLAPLLYMVALTLYIGISGMYGVDDTWDDDEDIKTREGLILSYVIMGVCALPAIHFNMIWTKEYEEFKSSS